MVGNVTDEEAFEIHMHNFIQWLQSISLEPSDFCAAHGNYNVAWELVNDLNSDGNAIIANPSSLLNQIQKVKISNFLLQLSEIPTSIFTQAITSSGNVIAMSHPCWAPIRVNALALLEIIELDKLNRAIS